MFKRFFNYYTSPESANSENKNLEDISTHAAIGIDLGTENCCIAAFKENEDEPAIITIHRGSLAIPSYVALDDDGNWLVGEEAKNQAVKNPLNTVFDVKRLIGRRFDDETDPNLERDIKKYWAHTVINENGKPKIELTVNGQKKTFFPEEISKQMLSFLKEKAKTNLGNEVSKATIAVPVYFNDAQRQMTMDAAEAAGFKKVHIISETLAAALGFHYKILSKKSSDSSFGNNYQKHNLFVIDLGGGMFVYFSTVVLFLYF